MDADLAETGTAHGRYVNPPIVEAVAEFFFMPSGTWTDVTPISLFERLQAEYPERPGTRKRIEAQIPLAADEAGQMSVTQRDDRIVFKNENKLAMFAPDALSVHSLKPYETWEAWLPRIERALGVYEVELAPGVVTKVALRYINHVEINEDSFVLSDYFTITQGLPDQFPDRLTAFFDRMQLAYDEQCQIVFTWATIQPTRDGANAFLLDLDLQWTDQCSIADAIARLRVLHDRENLAFESLINDRLRGVFNETT